MDKLISIYLIMFLALGRANPYCQLSTTDVSNTNWLFTYEANNQLYLLREDMVATGHTLKMICNGKAVVQTTCQANGAFSVPFPMSDCTTPVKSVVEPIADSKCAYTMYRVGYNLSAVQFFELYRACYDPNTMTGHFVIHESYPSNFTSRPTQGFTKDSVISGAMERSYADRPIYARFLQLFGPNQPYVSSARDTIIDRGHLAPSADFGFDQYMRLSFKYINVVAQFSGINRGHWKTIENWVRTISNKGPGVLVCTGATGVLKLPDSNGNPVAAYLLAPQSNPIPEWIYKIVKDAQGNRYAFVTYNNVYNPTVPTPNCIQIRCPSKLQFTPSRTRFSFCCDPHDFISRNVPNLAAVC